MKREILYDIAIFTIAIGLLIAMFTTEVFKDINVTNKYYSSENQDININRTYIYPTYYTINETKNETINDTIITYSHRIYFANHSGYISIEYDYFKENINNLTVYFQPLILINDSIGEYSLNLSFNNNCSLTYNRLYQCNNYNNNVIIVFGYYMEDYLTIIIKNNNITVI